ncbi:MAG: hypothetical protein BGO98_05255 [Myxococcales bacterium 68-20]|nr:NnrS family protein [Myxococcales bacterium]OJY28485.1 MAG: hypothetical protein BGO98_05255 [Myxococcales bacterium 68-20]
MAHALSINGAPSQSSSSGGRFSLFAKGFRPFFLLASVFGALMVPLWLLALEGVIQPASRFSPMYWHAHEMVFGFTVAVIAGFLLTAVGNWTQRETAVGTPLALLGVLWIAGRVAMSMASLLPPLVPVIVDLAFLPALAVVLARPLVATRNRRNFVMLAVLAALFAANLMTHLDTLGVAPGWQRRGALVAVDVVVLLMLIIAGRVVPMFTRNATGRDGIRSIPALEALTIGLMALLTAMDAFGGLALDRAIFAVLAGLAGVVAVARAFRWGTQHVLRQPLLWILHVGYAWIPLGLLLRAAGEATGGVYSSMATHALTAGAIGALTLGMMARVALGHTGRPLAVGTPMVAAFAAMTLAAAIRVAAPLLPEQYLASLVFAGVLWSASFVVYAIVYAPILVTPRADGRAG